MASTDTQIISYSPSSSFKSVDQFTYEVFLSFRGEDTRYGFTDHLYQALICYGIHTFRDDNELGRGRVIESELLNAIAKSKIFVIIFSKNYATSWWCLDELVKINECMAAEQRLILPIFYHVDPSEVRKQTGSYGKAFVDHEKEADEEKKAKIQKWRAVLTEVGNLAGYDLKKDRSEVEFIQKIREYVITILNRKPLHVGENIVGMDFYLEQLKPLIKTKLDEVHMVGICGIGGIGKTTISKAIYNDISSQFDGSSFLENVRGKYNDDLLEVQKTLLRDILKFEGPKFSCVGQGIIVIKERLRSKRVLIVVDNVDDYSQLENLVGKHGWYGAKSLIIITTRDKHLLAQCQVKEVYEVQKLNPKKSADLFNWWAFKQNTPKPNFESLSDNIVKYCDGLPIALKVLGGHLFDKTTKVWESALVKLKKTPRGEVQKLLKVSYDKLDYTEKCLFLDIACFFRGEDKDFVSRIFGSEADIGIEDLNDKCLITISENKLDMHDLLQQMGLEIVREECFEEPGKRSRLWDPNDVEHVLKNNTGTEKIEGLFVEISASSRIQFSTNSFTRLNNLRLLKVYYNWISFWPTSLSLDVKMQLPENFEFPSFELRYLHFENYPLESLPTKFDGRNLVELNLNCSSIKQLWKDNEILDKLKVINLSYSKHLVEILDFSSVPNLEILVLKGCTSFKSLPSSIGRLKALKHLNLECCMNLRSLPGSIRNLSSLETLILMGCSNLEGFPEIKNDMENLERLDLSETNIKELPYSIGQLDALKHLDLKSCAELVSLPKSIWNLSSLETLILMGCSNLEGFPEIKNNMENLERLDLSETNIKELPYSIEHLKALKHLDLKSCAELVSLPKSIWNLSSLKTLEVSNCPKLERLEVKLGIFFNPNPTCLILNGGIWWSNDRFSSLKPLDLQHNQMEKEVLNHHVFALSSLTELYISDSEGEENGILNDSFHLSSLEVLSVGNLKIMEGGILDAIFHQSSLKTLSLRNCNLMEAKIRSDIGNLSPLEKLSLTNCNLMDGEILNHVCHLSSLEMLSLEGSHFSSIPASINRLSHLRGLNLSHCNNLKVIPKLPSSLRFLDVHCSKGILSSPSWLSIPSLLNCFNSELIEENTINVDNSWFKGKGMSIVIPRRSVISEGTRNFSVGRDEVEIELPEHWYETDDLIGFALCCVYVPVLDDELRLYGKLAIGGDCPLVYKAAIWGYNPYVECKRCCNEHNDDSVSYQVWAIYYPKDVIKKEYRSNQWTHLKASFYSLRTLEVKACGIHPIYCCFECQQKEECQQKPCIERSFELGSLWECKHLESLLPRTICKLKSLTTLSCSGYSQLKIFPEIPETALKNLRELHLDGTAIKELPSSIHNLRGLQHLNLAYCYNLVSLPPTICFLESLVFLSCSGCSRLNSFPGNLGNMKNLRELYLDGTAIEVLPSSIQYLRVLSSSNPHLRELQHLNLANCNNLVSLPPTICFLESLVFLSCSGCLRLNSFPKISDNMENLRELHLDETAIEELPSSIQHLRGLQHLNLANCNNLVSLPPTICDLKSLVFLSCSGCSRLNSFPEILDNMENLRELHLEETAIEELPSSIQHLKGLQHLNLAYCNNLLSLPQAICDLKSLVFLSCSGCSQLMIFPKILETMEILRELQQLHLSNCNYLVNLPELYLSIVQLSKLRVLELSHCLLPIPQLPQSLRFLDAHGCPYLETLSSPSSLLGSSLFKCFKSAIEEFECGSYWSKEITIVISGNNRIPEWISHQKKGSEVRIELPMDWWEDNNFLGFALYSVFVPLHIESNEGPCSLTGELNIHVDEFESLGALSAKMWSVDELSFRSSYQCCHNGGESNRVWVAYYPKVAIRDKAWLSSWYRYLTVSFRGKGVKVDECGLHLIYDPNSLNRDSNGTNHWPRLLRENTDFNVKENTDAEDDPKQDPHHKKSRHF